MSVQSVDSVSAFDTIAILNEEHSDHHAGFETTQTYLSSRRADLELLFRHHQAVQEALTPKIPLPAIESTRDQRQKNPLLQRLRSSLLRAPSPTRNPPALPVSSKAVSLDTVFGAFSNSIKQTLLVKSYRAQIAALGKDDAMQVVEALQTWLVHCERDDPHRQTALHLLVKVAASTGVLPDSIFIAIKGLQFTEETVLGNGGYGTVYRATYGATPVAVKVIRSSSSSKDQVQRKLCREVLVWQHLKHAHVLPFIGLQRPILGVHVLPYMVSELATKGTLEEFMKTPDFLPSLDPLRLLYETADGVGFLHSQFIVHGDINSKNVLIGHSKQVQLADFGLLLLDDASDNTESGDRAQAPHWASPERISGERRTREDDIYAVGCLGYMLHSGVAPFHRFREYGLMRRICEGERPTRPQSTDELLISPPSDEMWSVIDACWSQQRSSRPSIGRVWELLGTMVHLRSHLQLLECFSSDATPPTTRYATLFEELGHRLHTVPENFLVKVDQSWIEELLPVVDWYLEQTAADHQYRGSIFNLWIKLVLAIHRPPASHPPQHGGIRRTRSPGWTDKYYGIYRDQNVIVESYRVLPFMKSRTHIQNTVVRGALIWKHLRHPRILPLMWANPGTLVIPRMMRGSLAEQMNPTARDRTRWMTEVAGALAHMHSLNVIHGDLHTSSVRLSDDHNEHAVVRPTFLGFAHLASADGTAMHCDKVGHMCWGSCETRRLDMKAAKSADVWSFACFCYMLLINRQGYLELGTALREGRSPWPDTFDYQPTNELLSLLNQCWSHDPEERPSMAEIFAYLSKLRVKGCFVSFADLPWTKSRPTIEIWGDTIRIWP